MRHAIPAWSALGLAALSALAACAKKDPLYCDPGTPCTDPDRPFCDDQGEYAASDGIKHTCIPYPWDGGPSADAGPACTPGEWVLDTIDDRKVEAWPNLAVDSAGTVHVAYSVGHPGVLHYARGRAGSWMSMETPEAGGFYPQLVIDSSSILHLVHGGSPGGLRYLRKGVNDEDFEYELAAPEEAFDIAFDLDTANKPVACFLDGNAGGPAKCLERTVDTWEAIEPPRDEYTSGASLAFDSSNTMHFVADGLVYFSRTDDVWSAEETIGGAPAAYTPVAVDSDDIPHVAFPSGTLRHAYRAGPNDWQSDTVDGAVDADSPALFIDRDDVLHVAYVDLTNSNLKYARRHGDRWSTETVDGTATIPATPKLFVDANGAPHIVYFDANDEDLRYAYLCP